MNKKIGRIFKGDKVIWMVFFFLCMISIVEVFSASSGLTYKSFNYIGPIVYHAATILFGVVVAVVTLNIPCRYFKLMTPFLMLISMVTLLWVLVAGTKVGDAGRWINLFGFTFQPSEIAKGTIVLAVAQILAAMQRENGADKKAFKWILWITLPACLFIGLENLSTAAMLFFVVFLMMVIGLVPVKQLAKLAAVIIFVGVFVLSMVMLIGHDTANEDKQLTKTERIDKKGKDEKSFVEKVFHRADTWKSRIMKFGKPAPTPQQYDLDKDAQVAHANIAIVSSGIIGKGPGKSVERDFLAQAFSDFIYAIIIEELGIVGAVFVVFLYVVLLYRCARIASRCENNFPAFLVMGLGLLLVVQATFNMMVAVGLAPVTGQPLPLISKGGTSTIINCAYVGAILSVSRSAKMKKVKENVADMASV
ncbi:MAG: FtsW/RodA/SpoVE family cell cycle protein [Prevotella sp.]|nr:FtsW/RodA/SpoVE family cell cycle protein [Prevotella sp.]MBQ9655621.1 FtsW/RodA/SpoVE family cell cycle protein [Prevotella sp.]